MTITIREPGSAFTHLLAMILTGLTATPLLIRAVLSGREDVFLGMFIFTVSMLLLYLASTVYHAVNLYGSALTIFRKIDHMMIFVLIAGSYTPVCLVVLNPASGRFLLTVVWGLALFGMVVKALWITCPKWFSSSIYIGMGWTCLLVFGQLHDVLNKNAFGWLLAGGIIYTVGGIIYAMKRPFFNDRFKYFGRHELFHVFVMLGSACHFVFMFMCID